jgi:hypothetical protein
MTIKTFTTGEVLTASDTNTYLANSGLVYISEQTISSATTTVSSCFSSTFTNYKIVIDLTASVSAGSNAVSLTLNGLSSGYAYNNIRNFATTVDTLTDSAGTSYFIGATNSTPCTFSSSIEVFKPNLAATTTFTHASHGFNSLNYVYYTGGCSVNNTTQYTGCVLTVTGGGTGKIFVYGYRQA